MYENSWDYRLGIMYRTKNNFVSGIFLKNNYQGIKKDTCIISKYTPNSHSRTCDEYGIPYDNSDRVVEWEWAGDKIEVRTIEKDVNYYKAILLSLFNDFTGLIEKLLVLGVEIDKFTINGKKSRNYLLEYQTNKINKMISMKSSKEEVNREVDRSLKIIGVPQLLLENLDKYIPVKFDDFINNMIIGENNKKELNYVIR